MKKRIACDEECADLLLSEGRKGRVEIILAASVQDGSRQSEGSRRLLRVPRLATRPADFFGLTSTPIRPAFGTTSRSSSSCFDCRSAPE